MKKIIGGYYIKARQIQKSGIATAAPYVREIWDWLLLEANHKDTSVCKRGECIRSYKDIREGLKWYVGFRKITYSKDQCENAMKRLRKGGMITTRKTTRGILISICNYDYYQDPDNYTDNRHDNRSLTTRVPHYKQEAIKKQKNNNSGGVNTKVLETLNSMKKDLTKKLSTNGKEES